MFPAFRGEVKENGDKRKNLDEHDNPSVGETIRGRRVKNSSSSFLDIWNDACGPVGISTAGDPFVISPY